MTISTPFGTILLTIGALFVFGLAYAALINWLRHKGYSEGYTAILVVGGVTITLSLSTILHQPEPLATLFLQFICFAASGLPMTINDIHRYAAARSADQRSIQEATSTNGTS